MGAYPYTVYPDPADNPYMVGVPCPYCEVGKFERCVTTGGNPYGELCHKKRKDAAAKAGVTLSVVKPPVRQEPEPDPSIPDKISALKLAFWYIDKIGGVDRARAYFEAAASALNGLPEGDG